jgi:two-component system, OmpR family, sensor histidine kinase PrrB
MLARLQASTAATERALHATRRFAADAGHELRTPLTGLRANLDALARNPDLDPHEREALVADMAAEQERIVHLLEGLQALARGEAAESLPREDVELGDLVDAALHSARRRHPGVAYDLDDEIADAVDGVAGTVAVAGETGSASVRGWDGGLRLLVDNLLDNAAVHGRAGGTVRVGLAREADALVLRVQDDGPGIAAGERERVLELRPPRGHDGVRDGPRPGDRRAAGRPPRRRPVARRLGPRRARRPGPSPGDCSDRPLAPIERG